jgi:PAS domain S-box-containing protein
MNQTIMARPTVEDLLARAQQLQERVEELQAENDRLRRQACPGGPQRLRDLVERLPGGAVFVEGDRIFLNRGAEQIVGYGRGELPTLTAWFERLYPGRAAAVRRLYEANRAAGFPTPRLISLIHKDGEERHVEFAGVLADEGEFWFVRDVTERSRLARLLEQTTSAAQVGGWEVDARTRKLYWTEETFRIHETTPGEYTPDVESATRFYTPECIPVITEAVERGLTQGEPFDVELEMVTAKGRRIWVRSRGVARCEDGRPVKLYGSCQDVTRQKQAEAQREEFQRNLVQTQKLESLGVLAGGIAHDFNNLLTGVLGNAELVRYVTPPTSPAVGYVQQIERAAQRAADLCKQMLAYAGKGRFLVEPIDLSALVAETTELLRLSAVSKKAELLVRPLAGLPAIMADATQLRQVLMNLVINASEALGDQEGLITVSTGLHPAGQGEPPGVLAGSSLPGGDYVFLEVSDTGCGMDPATQARIFEPFFTTKFTGRGLGLSAVLGIVRGHHGALTLRSAPGEGSTFRLYFPPTRRPIVIPRKSSLHAMPWGGGGLVMVVDDEDSVRRVSVELVRSFGFDALEARDGLEAVALMRRQAADVRLVLLDLTMPRLDGAQTLDQLRQIDADVRVILMSGYNQREVHERFAGKGLAGVLPKPFTRDLLGRRLREALGE